MICNHLSLLESQMLYNTVLRDRDDATMRRLCLEDLYFLLTVAMKRTDMCRQTINAQWLYERVREVEREPDDHLDLWAREHYKSTIITFGLTIQSILKDPELTVGIFSHTRPIAKAFLKQIKSEFEGNNFLKALFPDILWQNPEKEAPTWSMDLGIVVKRKTNPKENTVEAWGLVDGQPTSKHYSLLIYDDVVTKESVSTPDQIEKVTESWELSLNLGAQGGRRRYIGTRYHFNDTYRTILERQSATPRIYPATADGTISGPPVFLSQKDLDQKRRDFGPFVFSCQMIQNPVADQAQGFKSEWLRWYDLAPDMSDNFRRYIIIDPAGEKKKTNDYTVMLVVALGADRNYYLVDGIRDRLNLTQRTDKLFALVKKYRPNAVGYEKYGLQSDIEHIKYVQEQKQFRFVIKELGGNQISKNDRIRMLVPVFEQQRFLVPHRLLYQDYESKTHDLVREFTDEFQAFPVGVHDDIMDCMSRILDTTLGAEFPDLPAEDGGEQMPTVAKTTYDPYGG